MLPKVVVERTLEAAQLGPRLGPAIGEWLQTLPAPELPSPLWVAVQAGASGVLGLAVYIASGHWRRTSEARRRGRMSRLRLE